MRIYDTNSSLPFFFFDLLFLREHSLWVPIKLLYSFKMWNGVLLYEYHQLHIYISQLMDISLFPVFCYYKKDFSDITEIWIYISQGSGRKQHWNAEGSNKETYERDYLTEVWAGWMLRHQWADNSRKGLPNLGLKGKMVPLEPRGSRHVGIGPPSKSCAFPEAWHQR